MTGAVLESLLAPCQEPADSPIVPAAERLQRLAEALPQVAAILFLAQRAQCFHCGGALRLLGEAGKPWSSSREHVVPKAARSEDPAVRNAHVLAHKFCNEFRDERRLRAIEWQRCAELWTRADRFYLEAGGAGSPFLAWIKLAEHMQQVTT